jgi:hypothetical protein
MAAWQFVPGLSSIGDHRKIRQFNLANPSPTTYLNSFHHITTVKYVRFVG